jgi:hypothetical protein
MSSRFARPRSRSSERSSCAYVRPAHSGLRGRPQLAAARGHHPGVPPGGLGRATAGFVAGLLLDLIGTGPSERGRSYSPSWDTCRPAAVESLRRGMACACGHRVRCRTHRRYALPGLLTVLGVGPSFGQALLTVVIPRALYMPSYWCSLTRGSRAFCAPTGRQVVPARRLIRHPESPFWSLLHRCRTSVST